MSLIDSLLLDTVFLLAWTSIRPFIFSTINCLRLSSRRDSTCGLFRDITLIYALKKRAAI